MWPPRPTRYLPDKPETVKPNTVELVIVVFLLYAINEKPIPWNTLQWCLALEDSRGGSIALEKQTSAQMEASYS